MRVSNHEGGLTVRRGPSFEMPRKSAAPQDEGCMCGEVT